jgi:hypothetical protein
VFAYCSRTELSSHTDNKHGPLLYVGVHVDQGVLLYSGDDDEIAGI